MPPSTTLLAAKVAIASAALAAGAFSARAAVPHVVSAAGFVVPRAWAVARFWLAPPYLVVTVNLIILVIWKLSDRRHFQAAAHQHHKDPWPVAVQHATHPPAGVAVHAVEDVAPAVKLKEDALGAYGGQRVVDDDSSPHQFSPDSGGGDSCVTTESDEDATSEPSYYYSVEARAPAQERRTVLERELALPPQTVDSEGDDDLDATWNAIMQKTRSAPAVPAPAPAPPAQRSPPPRARDPSVGAEEMNRRFDDFIKKNRNSFGRQ